MSEKAYVSPGVLDYESSTVTVVIDEPLRLKFRMFAVMAAPFLLAFAFVCFLYAVTTDLHTGYAVKDILLGIFALEFARVLLEATYRGARLWDELSE